MVLTSMILELLIQEIVYSFGWISVRRFIAVTTAVEIKLSVLPPSTMIETTLPTVPLVRNKLLCWLWSSTRGVVHKRRDTPNECSGAITNRWCTSNRCYPTSKGSIPLFHSSSSAVLLCLISSLSNRVVLLLGHSFDPTKQQMLMVTNFTFWFSSVFI